MESKAEEVRTGYHGTSQEYAAEILQHGFREGNRPENRMGEGVYFWEDHLEDARWWVTRGRERPREWAILSARITLGRCLDFVNRDHVKKFSVMKRYFLGAAKVEEANDWEVVNYIHEKACPVDSVRFGQMPEKWPGSYFRLLRIIIVVRNLALIGPPERVEEGIAT